MNRILGEFGKRYVEQQEKLLDIGITLEVSMQDGKIIPEKGQKAQDILDLELACGSEERQNEAEGMPECRKLVPAGGDSRHGRLFQENRKGRS